jgi:hypothetical protein
MADLDEAGEMTDACADVVTDAERGELRDLVRAAIAGLNPGEREVIELNLRHDLEGADLADALGIPLNQAYALSSRARGQLERSLGALLVARTGREYCPDLAGLLAGWNGQLTVLLRKRVNRHIERCDVCGERKRRELSPAMLLSALPIVMLPPGLREQVLWLVADDGPDAVRYREMVTRRAEPFGAAGFPVPISPWTVRRWTRGRTVAYSTAAALIVIVGSGIAAAAILPHGHGPVNAAAHVSTTSPTGTALSPSPSSPVPASSHRSASGTPTPTPTPTPTVTPTVTPPAPTPVPSPTATRSRTPRPTPPPTRPPSPSPTPTKSPAPSPSPSVPPGTLETSTTTVTVPEAGASATFTLTAVGGPVASFSITQPPGLSVSPSTGSLTAGDSVTITVTAVGNGPPDFQTVLTVSPGGGTVTVVYPPSG